MGNSRKIVGLVLVIVFLTSLISIQPTAKAQTKTITVPDDYSTLSSAIENATDGYTILVKTGTYVQQTLEINKSVTIISEHIGGSTLILHPPQVPESLFGTTIMVYVNPIKIEANNVKVSGFIIKSDGGTISAAGDQIQITNNQIETCGVLASGNGNRITGNKMASLNLIGSNQTITDNDLSDLSVKGSFNLIARNHGRGLTLNGSYNCIDQNIFSIVSGTDGGSVSGIGILTGDHNVVINNNVLGQGTGIAVGYPSGTGGSYNIFAGNKVQEAGLWGILMGNGNYNLFYGNLIANNRGFGHDGYGLAMGGTHYQVQSNLVFHNTFLNNSKNFGTNWGVNGVNFFDNGVEGNYWDDYLTKYPNAIVIDQSGIGNIPYLVYNNVTDNYPLMTQPEVTGVIPALPEPWSTLLIINPLNDPALTFEPNQTTPTATPKLTPITSITPSPTDSINQSESPTPSIPELSWLVLLFLCLIMLPAALVLRHRKHVLVKKV